MKDAYPVAVIKRKNAYVAIGGFRVCSMLSAGLFTEANGMGNHGSATTVWTLCQDRWTDFAHTIASFPKPMEMLFTLFGNLSEEHADTSMLMAFLSVGRGNSRDAAISACRRMGRDLQVVLTTSLDYLEFEIIDDDALLEELLARLSHGKLLEIRRRFEHVRVSHGRFSRKEIGFGRSSAKPVADSACSACLDHLFSWVPSDDPWKRLLEAFAMEEKPRLFAVHVQGLSQTPDDCLDEARSALASAELLMGQGSGADAGEVPNILHLEVASLRDDALHRLKLLEGQTLAARVFLAGDSTPSDALVATLVSVIHDASVYPGQRGTEPHLRGGARVAAVPIGELLEPLEEPSLDLVFGVTEMGAVLRTPMPMETELPGLRLFRARTCSMLGRAGTDCPLGTNLHRGKSRDVALDQGARFYHSYIIGQTGTGKSTLMLNMILHDIRAGRGVGVLDPHGSLYKDIIERIPSKRIQDVVLLDATDVEYPVGMNVLRIDEEDAFEYQRTRDIIIDDLYNYLDRMYDFMETGGPMFEMHFRGMLALLMGIRKRPDLPPPNLMIFRSCYTNEELQNKLVNELQGKDPVVETFLQEARRVTGEGGIANIAPYVTSKFTRFTQDVVLRNMVCQNNLLDFNDIVNNKKILLINMAKGQFGEQAAALLSSQVVTRICLAAMKRGAHADVEPFYLYADEFQLFADQRFAELLAEARKFRLSLTLAHQFMEQLPPRVLSAVLGNVGTILTLRVSGNDGRELEPVFLPTFGHQDIASLGNYRAYVRTQGTPGNLPFSLQLPPPPPPGSAKRAQAVREYSRKRYARPREEVEREVIESYTQFNDTFFIKERDRRFFFGEDVDDVPNTPSPEEDPPTLGDISTLARYLEMEDD